MSSIRLIHFSQMVGAPSVSQVASPTLCADSHRSTRLFPLFRSHSAKLPTSDISGLVCIKQRHSYFTRPCFLWRRALQTWNLTMACQRLPSASCIAGSRGRQRSLDTWLPRGPGATPPARLTTLTYRHLHGGVEEYASRELLRDEYMAIY